MMFQLLLAPTPFIIGVTDEFVRQKQLKRLPGDIWLVDLDSGEVMPPLSPSISPPSPSSAASTGIFVETQRDKKNLPSAVKAKDYLEPPRVTRKVFESNRWSQN